MVYTLIELAAMNSEKRANQEVLKSVIIQHVEDDSILGSQMLTENEEDETFNGTTVDVEENQHEHSSDYVNEEFLSKLEPSENQSNPSSHHSAEENFYKDADDNETVETSEYVINQLIRQMYGVVAIILIITVCN